MNNFKKFFCVVLVALVMFSLMGCQPEVSGMSIPLTEEKKQEINDAWKAKYGHGLSWGGSGGCIYYGTYGDCIVFFEQGQLTTMTTINIAGQEFIYGWSFLLRVYRNGEFMELEQAYEDGYITKSQIKELAKYHKSLNEKWYD